MAIYSSDYGRREKQGGEDARAVVKQNLNAVESGVDLAIDSAKDVVHDLRDKAQDITEAMLDRVSQSWERQQPRIKAYMDAHPWVVVVGLILLAYLFSGSQQKDHPVTYH
jgi:CHASE3 domain sensor protein